MGGMGSMGGMGGMGFKESYVPRVGLMEGALRRGVAACSSRCISSCEARSMPAAPYRYEERGEYIRGFRSVRGLGQAAMLRV